MECSQVVTKQRCTCTYEPCSRKGKCCECVEFHKGSGELPGCVFTREQEATYDRSIGFFVRTHA
jgi:hypothetical protein